MSRELKKYKKHLIAFILVLIILVPIAVSADTLLENLKKAGGGTGLAGSESEEVPSLATTIGNIIKNISL